MLCCIPCKRLWLGMFTQTEWSMLQDDSAVVLNSLRSRILPIPALFSSDRDQGRLSHAASNLEYSHSKADESGLYRECESQVWGFRNLSTHELVTVSCKTKSMRWIPVATHSRSEDHSRRLRAHICWVYDCIWFFNTVFEATFKFQYWRLAIRFA